MTTNKEAKIIAKEISKMVKEINKKPKMKTDNELMDLIKQKLENALDELWISIPPHERQKVFSKLISEYIDVNY